MRLHKYESEKEYSEAQIKMGTEGFNDRSCWVTKVVIDAVCDYVKNKKHSIGFGICHGVRTGTEVEAFRLGLGDLASLSDANIIGTDICPVVSSVGNVIVHDFHYAKEEWINSVDFIYTNSLDHSNRPKECLESWFSCLTPEGLCFIDWGASDDSDESSMSYADCFAATAQECEDMLNEVGQVVDVIDIPMRTIYKSDVQGVEILPATKIFVGKKVT